MLECAWYVLFTSNEAVWFEGKSKGIRLIMPPMMMRIIKMGYSNSDIENIIRRTQETCVLQFVIFNE